MISSDYSDKHNQKHFFVKLHKKILYTDCFVLFLVL